MLPKKRSYVKRYDGQIKWMYFLIEDDNLLEKYDNISDKASTDIKKEIVYNKVFLKTKINVTVMKLQIKKLLRWALILLLKKMKTFIFKCFQKNANKF